MTARPRRAGVLLHPTSLPGPYGVGDLGPAARRWVDVLAAAGQAWWQVLPLTPPGMGDSPYQSFSAFAGSPLLVSPDDLFADGLLDRADLAADFPPGKVDYAAAGRFKDGLLATAWANYRAGRGAGLRAGFEAFAAAEAGWLQDYALFAALKETQPPGAWTDWPAALARRDPAALRGANAELADAVGRQRFTQFLFAKQLTALRAYAAARGVGLIGDLPIFIAADSADVWANPGQFQLDAGGRPRVVAGVPPDYFSATGQRWGNPHYDWAAMRADGFAWWVARVRATLAQVDLIRIDHFRGFQAYWEIPAANPTAEGGRWVEAPGAELFETLATRFGGLGPGGGTDLPFIAEDLGVITPAVDALRERFGLPGMRIVQFAFGGAVEERFLPHGYDRNVVAYTGTHDNDTTPGWAWRLTAAEARALRRYAPDAAADPAGAVLRLAWASVADTAIAPLQDVVGLGSEARMNTPGTAAGNWAWRADESMLGGPAFDRLGEWTETYGRRGGNQKSATDEHG